MHPLLPNLAEIATDELHKKFSDLQTRLNSAYRFGRSDQVYQLQLLLQGYNEEIQRRNQKELENLEKNSKNFKNIIDIQ
jgi:hypothetical protein